MSAGRPIHTTRALRSTPDRAEPTSSFEEESFLLAREDQFEDEFHRRLTIGTRREASAGSQNGGGASFWRTTSSTATTSASSSNEQQQQQQPQAPNFASVSIWNTNKGTSEGGGGGGASENSRKGTAGRASTGLLAAALQRRSSLDSVSVSIESQPWTPLEQQLRRDSSVSQESSNSKETPPASKSVKDKKDSSKQRKADRQRKLDSQTSDVDIGHIMGDDNSGPFSPPPFADVSYASSNERSSSDQSSGSLLYGKTPSAGTLLGKSSSLIFPTGVDSTADVDSESSKLKRRKINLALDQCETARFPFQRKLMLNNINLSAADIPLKDLVGTNLGNSLNKLSLSGNRLGTVPPKLVQALPVLKQLDLSQCELTQLPEKWSLPKLARLNLSHNRLTEFPEESMLEGLPDLQELNMYGNKVAEIIIPTNPKLLCKLEKLDLGYNDLVYLPPELDQLKSLRSLRVMNNFLAKVPMRVCDMDLKTIDVSSNPITEPPIETCERGIFSMRRYWHCIRMEEQSKQKSIEEAKNKEQKQQKKKKTYGGLGIMKTLGMGSNKASPSTAHKTITENAPQPAPPISSRSVGSPSPSIAPNPMLPPMRSESEPAKRNPFSLDMDSYPMFPSNEIESRRMRRDSAEGLDSVISAIDFDEDFDTVTVNDTLKVIFVGMAMVGKTSMIRRLIEGRDAVIPTHDERTVGVDIYEWEPKLDRRFEHIDSRIIFEDKELAELCGDVDVKFSVWDFAGQHVYHATHELFFSSRALYVLVWDMGATNKATMKRKKLTSHDRTETGAFRLSYDSSSEEEDEEEEDDDLAIEEEARRADRALERDIDEKVQFWVDCIQSSAPGAAILPVASFSDFFDREGGEGEANRRCFILKQRLLKHEETRIKGIKDRLKMYDEENRADDRAAVRLRKLLGSYTRPKLIFGDEYENSVVQVSGLRYTGFDVLTKRVIDIATGRDRLQYRFPIFHGHIGARIPRMRLQVREKVREMRDKFKVVEWGYFINELRDMDLTNVEDISDALHFLTNTGELSYFGSVMTNSQPANPIQDNNSKIMDKDYQTDDDDDLDFADDDQDQALLSMDDTSITVPSTADFSSSTVADMMSGGLSQFVFLNPRWLVAAVACILRHDLDREIKEARRLRAIENGRRLEHTASFNEAHLNCPVITADDACMLWEGKRITKKAAERAQEYSNNMLVTPFEFLQLLLIRFGVFVPIDLTIEKAFLGGKEYGITQESHTEVEVEGESSDAKFFFLPSLLGPCEPSDAWTYKSTDSWKTTICHSVLFPDGVPPGLMERLTASVLSSIYAVSGRPNIDGAQGHDVGSYEGKLSVKEILCWRTAFYLKVGTHIPTSDGTKKESIVEIFTHLADRESHLCVGSDHMAVGMRRLITSGRGQVGDGGRKIWKGGYLTVVKCIHRVMEVYGGLEFEKQGFCPECLAKKSVSEASAWDMTKIRAAVLQSEGTLRCHYGHRVDTRLVAGPLDALQKPRAEPASAPTDNNAETVVPVRDLLRAVVVVGLWDGATRKVVRVGSGFIVDRKHGLIVTASHTLMNVWGDKNFPYGENYYGLKQGKVVIGVIPDREAEGEGSNNKDMAVFRYFAKIVTKDPSLYNGECHLDACVLKITTRLEHDVGGNGEGCGDQPEILLLNNTKAMKNEHLQILKITDKCELDEQVRIVGYNQGGEGLLGPGENLNRFVDFARGYVCMKFAHDTSSTPAQANNGRRRDRFRPREEIVVICPTIGGHSGGPCVNQQGEVIGILSRADPAENQRCYISPTYEWKHLVKEAKNEGKNFF